MTDKIKEVREAVEKAINNPFISSMVGVEPEYFLQDMTLQQMQTILEALSAYEKLQGVDGMKIIPNIDRLPHPHHVGFRKGYNQAIDDVKARLVADIGGK